MRSRFAGVVVVLAAVLVGVLAVVSQAQAGRPTGILPRTTAPDLYVTIKVTMTDAKFTLSLHSAPRGADARFVVRNVGSKPDTFAVGKETYGQGVQSGFSVTVKPGQQKILILFLDIRGKIPYYSALHKNNKAMSGEFLIGPCTHYESVTGVGEC